MSKKTKKAPESAKKRPGKLRKGISERFSKLRMRMLVARVRRKKRREKLRKLRLFKRLGILIVVALVLFIGGRAAWNYLTDASEFDITIYQLKDDKITGNVRIAFLSDLHLSEFGEGNTELIQAVKRLSPDVILIGGDMTVSKNPDTHVALELVEGLMPIAQVYYALGNHEYNDYLFEGSTIISDLNARGAVVLSDHYVTVEVNGNLIDIGGLNEMSNHFHQEPAREFYEKFTRSENYRLLLAHDPAYFTGSGALRGAEIDLALCGHRHGGQIIVPYLGGLYHPGSGVLPELTDGARDILGTWVVVSRGLGNSGSLPRVNNPPELVIIDIY